MTMKKNETKQENVFTKAQIIASKKYSNRRDVLNAILPEDFQGTFDKVDSLLKKFMKGKVK